jgi:protein SCO1
MEIEARCRVRMEQGMGNGRATVRPASTQARWAIHITVLLFTLLALGCSDAPRWQTSALAEDFPPLAFELDVHDRMSITEEVLLGHVTLLFFGYMSCPDVCPTTMSTLRSAIAALPATEREHVRVLFVSVDPERDDLPRLAAYASHYGPQFIGATTEPERVRQLVARYGSAFQAEHRHAGSGHYLVTHGSHVYAFDRNGHARLLIRANDSVEAISHDLQRLLSL